MKSAHDATINIDEAQRFLDLLEPNGKFTFQTFSDKKDSKDKSIITVRHGTLAEHETEFAAIQDRGGGIFVTVNETDLKGRAAANVTRVRAVFVDLDGSPLEPVLACSLPPSITVASSPGRYHAYWLADDVPLEEFRRVQKSIIQRFGGDKAVHDLPRVMRLPGYLHLKGEPFQTRILQP